VAIAREWNTIAHLSDYEGSPASSPWIAWKFASVIT